MSILNERPRWTATASRISLCAACGQQLAASTALCAHHATAEGGWAAGNRIMCDFFHRRIAPPRLGLAERERDVDPYAPQRCVSAEG